MNWVQRAVAAADLVSAQLSKANTRCLRQPLQSLRIVRETTTDAVITAHLEQAREDVANGDREGFERHCEHAGQLARWHAPDRLDDIERLLEAHADRHTGSLCHR
jgi:hypothetical protein